MERWRDSGGWVKEVGDSANRLIPFRVEFELTSIFGQVYPPSTRHQPTYPCHGYGVQNSVPQPVPQRNPWQNPCSSLVSILTYFNVNTIQTTRDGHLPSSWPHLWPEGTVVVVDRCGGQRPKVSDDELAAPST